MGGGVAAAAAVALRAPGLLEAERQGECALGRGG